MDHPSFIQASFPSYPGYKTDITREALSQPQPEISELYTSPPRLAATHPNWRRSRPHGKVTARQGGGKTRKPYGWPMHNIPKLHHVQPECRIVEVEGSPDTPRDEDLVPSSEYPPETRRKNRSCRMEFAAVVGRPSGAVSSSVRVPVAASHLFPSPECLLHPLPLFRLLLVSSPYAALYSQFP